MNSGHGYSPPHDQLFMSIVPGHHGMLQPPPNMGHPGLPGGRRAGTPAASKKISDWMARSTRAEEVRAGRGSSRPVEDDVHSQRSGFSAYSYSSGTSLQSYSGVWQ